MSANRIVTRKQKLSRCIHILGPNYCVIHFRCLCPSFNRYTKELRVWILLHCKFLPHENCGDFELRGPCRENLHNLWKRAVRIPEKPVIITESFWLGSTLGTINFQQQIKDTDNPLDLLYYFHITRWQDVYILHMKNMNKFCWQLRRQDIIWAKVQADVISSIMAKLEVAKNIHLQMWFFFAICIPSDKGGFQLEFLCRVINHRTCYKFSAFIGWNYSIQTGEIILQSIFLK